MSTPADGVLGPLLTRTHRQGIPPTHPLVEPNQWGRCCYLEDLWKLDWPFGPPRLILGPPMPVPGLPLSVRALLLLVPGPPPLVPPPPVELRNVEVIVCCALTWELGVPVCGAKNAFPGAPGPWWVLASAVPALPTAMPMTATAQAAPRTAVRIGDLRILRLPRWPMCLASLAGMAGSICVHVGEHSAAVRAIGDG